MNKFEYLNYLTSKAKETYDPTKNLRTTGTQLFNQKNSKTFKVNNGQYKHY